MEDGTLTVKAPYAYGEQKCRCDREYTHEQNPKLSRQKAQQTPLGSASSEKAKVAYRFVHTTGDAQYQLKLLQGQRSK